MNTFPFVAITGQTLLKKALLLALVDPKIGGVLISGSRGSAKSTLVRGLQELEKSMPVVTLPLGASEEMVTGSLRIDRVVQNGELEFSPGLLAKADMGMLYVDEVNLLPDHLVDLLLDVAASGVNQVERDGISHSHKSRFVLIGTMNPDEGELRPQLLDRFALLAPVETQFSIAQRKEIVVRRLAFDKHPDRFAKTYSEQTARLRKTVAVARLSVETIKVEDFILTDIAERCSEANVEGFRADLAMYRASVAHAALRGESLVAVEDIDAVEQLVLGHRQTKPSSDNSRGNDTSQSSGGDSVVNPDSDKSGSSIQGSWGDMPAEPILSEVAQLEPLVDQEKLVGGNDNFQPSDEHGKGKVAGRAGSRWTSVRSSSRINWLRTVSHPQNLKISGQQNSSLKWFYRQPIQHSRTLDLVLLDTSVSTLSGRGLHLAQGALRYFSELCYQRRRQLSLIAFGNNHVQVLLPARRAPKDLEPVLSKIRAGGGTPIHQVLAEACVFLRNARKRFEKCNLYLITDGRFDSNVSETIEKCEAQSISIIDTEISRVRLARCKALAQTIGATYFHIEQLQPK
jgi:magnesium chelatase subunit D